ncbi:hypothetical protein ACLK17_02725 [Escherichia coli]
MLAPALGIAFGAVELFDVSFAPWFFAGMVLNESNSVTVPPTRRRDCATRLRCRFVSVGMLFDPLI